MKKNFVYEMYNILFFYRVNVKLKVSEVTNKGTSKRNLNFLPPL